MGLVHTHPLLLGDIEKNEIMYLNNQPLYLNAANTNRMTEKNFKKLFLERGDRRTPTAFSI